jgi:hypothetical protein
MTTTTPFKSLTAAALIAAAIAGPAQATTAGRGPHVCDSEPLICACLGLTAALAYTHPENKYAGEIANTLAAALADRRGWQISDEDNPAIIAAMRDHIRQHGLQSKKDARTCFRLALANGYRPDGTGAGR